MPKNRSLVIITTRKIISKIHWIRGRKVMIDSDLATLYSVLTGTLIQAVKRNKGRFPADFMFRLNAKEHASLISQTVISKGRGGRRFPPYVFTEQGVAMLSSILNSERAIHVNIQIMRTFAKIKQMLSKNELLREKIEELERKYEKHDKQFKIVFDAPHELLKPAPAPKKKPIGFHVEY